MFKKFAGWVLSKMFPYKGFTPVTLRDDWSVCKETEYRRCHCDNVSINTEKGEILR